MDLVLTPKALPAINGNFDLYKKELTKTIEGYKKSPLTEETVAPVKSAIRQIRTTLEKIESTAISAYFDTPKAILRSQFAELYSIIADGEDKVDAIIMEETRKRNEARTSRFLTYIKSKIKEMDLEPDAVDFVIIQKAYLNKTAKEVDSLNSIDAQILLLQKNFASYTRAVKKIDKKAKELGPVFNKNKFLFALSKYGDNNDNVSSQVDEEVERLLAIPEEEVFPKKQTSTVPTSEKAAPKEIEEVTLSINFPVVDKKKSKGTEDMSFTFSVPKEAKKNFNDLIKMLQETGIKSIKL